jgi:hypothetical protein
VSVLIHLTRRFFFVWQVNAGATASRLFMQFGMCNPELIEKRICHPS